MVARLVRDQEVVGSNPVASTTKKGELFGSPFFVCQGEAIRDSRDVLGIS